MAQATSQTTHNVQVGSGRPDPPVPDRAALLSGPTRRLGAHDLPVPALGQPREPRNDLTHDHFRLGLLNADAEWYVRAP